MSSTIKFLIGADILPNEANEDLFINGTDEDLVGAELASLLRSTDFRVFNLEGPLTNAKAPILLPISTFSSRHPPFFFPTSALQLSHVRPSNSPALPPNLTSCAEKTQNIIKKMISQDYEIGAKLPSIMSLAKQLDVSPNTVRKAFHNLAKDGYLAFSRGRYGGTFVIDIPETEEETYKWLAVNPQYTESYKN